MAGEHSSTNPDPTIHLVPEILSTTTDPAIKKKLCAYVDERRGISPHDFVSRFSFQEYCTEAHRIAAANARAGADDARRNARNAKRRKLSVPNKRKCQFKGAPAHWFKPKRGDQFHCTVEHRKAASWTRQNARNRKHPVPTGKRRCQFKGAPPHFFKPKPRIGEDGINRGIYPGQEFCSEKHKLSEHSRRWNEKYPDKRKLIDAKGNKKKQDLITLGRLAKKGELVPLAEVDRLRTQEAEGLLFPAQKPKGKRGRPVSKRSLYMKADKLNSQGVNWPQCAEILVPDEVKRDGRTAAGERLRKGVYSLPHQAEKIP